MKIPLVDLTRQYRSIQREIDGQIRDVIDSGTFVLGTQVSQFEREFAAYCGAKHAIGVGSGTEALVLALRALGIGEGDEVITAPNTFIATAEAISLVGAKPVFADIDSETCNIDARKIEPALTRRTKVIIPVHLYGRLADMEGILEIATRHHLKIIEDACQAHGARDENKQSTSPDYLAAFSFYPAKNLGAYGDGGAVVTNIQELAEKISVMRNHGSVRKYYHQVIGLNSRLDELQAAVLRVKLKYLDSWNRKRRENAGLYARHLRESVNDGLVTIPAECEEGRHVYHLYVIQAEENKRDRLLEYLNANGVGAQIHYPVPIHLQEAYKHLGCQDGDFPVAEKTAKRIISLPMFPELEEREIEYIASRIKVFLKG